MEFVYINREVNYYELDFSFTEGNKIETFFETVTRLGRTRASIRYQRFGDKYIFIQGITNSEGLISAKLRCIRLDLFPEIIDMTTDIVKEIEGGEYEGICETTHIVIDYRKRRKTILAFEYNHHGAKIVDLLEYLKRIGINQNILDGAGYSPIVNGNLTRLKERINRISEFSMKLHKSNLPQLQAMDGQIFQSASAAVGHFENEYANVDLKIDYRNFEDTPVIKKSIFNIISYLSLNPTKRHIFNYIKFRGEDEEKNNVLQTFDLLLDKIYSPVRVQRKKKQKTIISEDMFPKMIFELDKLKLNER